MIEEIKHKLTIKLEQQIKQETLEVLKYYADKENYKFGEYGYQLVAPIEFDRGNLARMVLKKILDNGLNDSLNPL